MPIGHQDQLSQYLFDSIQIASLYHLSLSQFYELGQAFRSDSMASFFDALIIQLSGGWQLAILVRLLCIVFSFLLLFDLLNSYRTRSLWLVFAVLCIGLSLPDLWGIGVSGKHDSYAMFFELLVVSCLWKGFRADICSDPFVYACLALIFQVGSIASRLSSISLGLISVPFVMILFVRSYRSEAARSDSGRYKLMLLAFLVFTGLAASWIFALNWIYLDNPFYRISPPGVFASLWPDAQYISNYSLFRDTYNIKLHVPVLSNLFALVYAGLGLEVFRFALSKLSGSSHIAFQALSAIASVGPTYTFVSIISLTPAIFLPLFLNHRAVPRSARIAFLFLLTWALLWTSGITYTRVFMAGSLALVSLGFACYEGSHSAGLTRIAVARALICLSFVYALLFSVWSLSHTFDLLQANGLGGSRESAVIRFLEMTKRDSLTLYGSSDIAIPTEPEVMAWNRNEKGDSRALRFLVDVPPYFAYLFKGFLVATRPLTIVPLNSYPDGVQCFSFLGGKISGVPCG